MALLHYNEILFYSWKYTIISEYNKHNGLCIEYSSRIRFFIVWIVKMATTRFRSSLNKIIGLDRMTIKIFDRFDNILCIRTFISINLIKFNSLNTSESIGLKKWNKFLLPRLTMCSLKLLWVTKSSFYYAVHRLFSLLLVAHSILFNQWRSRFLRLSEYEFVQNEKS